MENSNANSFVHAPRLGGSVNQIDQLFGPLAGLIGTWTGNRGWNLVAVPKQNGRFQFTLLTAPYFETITISALSTPTPNRGSSTIEEVPTLLYSLQINNAVDGSLLHAENGTWLMLDKNLNGGFNIARQASIPHGDSVLAIGNIGTFNGPPTFPVLNTVPVGQPPHAQLGYHDPYDSASVPPGLNKKNPNATLAEAIVGQNIIHTTTLHVSTSNQGGISNIPFIKKNADATSFDATYWLETVKDSETGKTFLQLQYSQNTSIDFFPLSTDPTQLIKWPHVNINTLTKQ